MKFLRSILGFLLLLIFLAPDIFCAEDQTPVAPTDQFVQNFADSLRNEDVVFQDGKLKILRLPSNEVFFCAVAGLVNSVALFSFFEAIEAQKTSARTILSLTGIALFSLAIYLVLKGYEKNPKQVLMMFDDEGFYLDGKFCLRWSDVATIDIENEIELAGNKRTYGTRAACFLNVYKSLLLWLSENKFAATPISFDNFVVLAKHFIDKVNEITKSHVAQG